MNYESSMNFYKNLIESGLANYLSGIKNIEKNLMESMGYSLLSGGKRIRPILMMAFHELFGGNPIDIIPFACSIEMIHTYSLIHDDLPCMDNSNLRRGKPSNHIAFGEELALLAGDALLTNAFDIITSDKILNLFNAEKIVKVTNLLSSAAGASGMVSGQIIDLSINEKNANINLILDMYMKKTGLLIECAAQMGAVLANASDEQLGIVKEYGRVIGLEFQLVDDVLDIYGDENVIGKPSGSDNKNNKHTYLSICGLEKTKEKIRDLTCEAVDILNDLGEGTKFLKELTVSLGCRVS